MHTNVPKFKFDLQKFEDSLCKKKHLNKWQIVLLIFTSVFAFLFLVINIFFDGKSLNNLELLFSSNPYDVGLYTFAPISNFIVGFCLSSASIAITVTTKNVLSGPTTLGFTPMIILANTSTFLISIEEKTITALLYVFSLLFCFALIATNFVLTKGNIQNAGFKPILISFAIGATVTAINIVVISQINDLKRDFATYVGFTVYPASLTKFLVSNILMIVTTIILFILSTRLNVIKKDFLLAKSLGIRVNLIYWMVAIGLVIITVSASMLIGIVALIGVVINIIINNIFKYSSITQQMFYAGLFGSVVLSFAGYFSEFLAGTREIVIAILAIPTFIYVLFKRKNKT
ncbi:iron chelate uptake ABC transporter family permease subunit [Ureaplasma sp. ES3154-GEN]|uniref:iron chelate uptake ABC transporter family permease subunit n=1 Tax=Ureaplasma sp. ES3154-GEN TaxID=2984844 RepID=UPI0021E9419F|nr:iron chelate uptake ABC transporter family permease subunit [Ureaplasma sp. ES3154-GEN]MCV3743798.1 iron chelate uptake ABC transporter family permease subunit [Ureaplasma sp. ES3154-GEN]